MDNPSAASAETLKKVDAIVLVDVSTSMGNASLRFSNKNRLQEVEESALGVARDAEKFDTDGITIIAFGSTVQGPYDGVTSSKLQQVFQEFRPNGSTNLTAALEAAQIKARESIKNGKEAVIICYTDGEPNDQGTVISTLNAIGKEFGRPKVGIVFIQVGTDPGATAFLQKLDNDLKVDIVDTVPAAEAETLEYAQLVTCAQQG
jgi:uncharacterized protein YegL